MLTLPYSYNWKNFHNKINEKRSQENKMMDPEYVTGQIDSRILELLLRRFCCLDLNMLWSDKAFSQRPQKIF